MTISFFLGILAAYLLGSIPSAVWIGKIFYRIDVREHGSGNAGATNVIRVLGPWAGLPVLLFDVFKAWLAVDLGNVFVPDFYSVNQLVNYQIALGAIAVVGHVFPVFAHFRGGKGVATIVGVIIALYPVVFPIILVWFVLVLLSTGYVSVSSITSSILLPVLVIVIFREEHISLILLSILIGVFIPLMHRKNIHRLLRGEESKFRVHKK
jgi:glycerol-3-phosphate acyltransferase PlsY